jgi:hypothetical protein
MEDVSAEARAIMRQNASAYGGRRGGYNPQPVDMQTSSALSRPSFFSRVGQALANIWMGPGEPMPIAAPAETPDRAWDYPIFWNYSVQPDAAKAKESGVTMLQLRMLGQQTHVALAREKLKNKQKKKRWQFGLERLPGEAPHQAMARAMEDSRVKEIADFFRMPDGENELPEWLGLNLGNMVTLGVTTVVPWRTRGGRPYRLEVYDPATIVPKLDAGGRRPTGVDADGEPAVAYQQYIHGVTFKDFSDADLLWYGPNPETGKVYPIGPTEKLLLYINIALRKDAQRLAAYTDTNIPRGLLPMPPTWNEKQITDWYKNFNLFIVNLPENMAKMVPIPYAGAGANPIFPGQEILKDQWEEHWQRLVSGFFSVPVSASVVELTVANAKSNREQADEEGEQYYEDVCRRFINRCISKFFGYTDVVARTESEVETDLKRQAEIDLIRVSKGLDQVNEIRERDGKPPIAALVGVDGYFNAKGDFTPFDAAVEAARNPAPPPQFGGDGGDESGSDAADGGNVVAMKLLKAKKKESRSGNRSSSRSIRELYRDASESS